MNREGTIFLLNFVLLNFVLLNLYLWIFYRRILWDYH